MDSTKIIIGMASATVASATIQIILKALGKKDESAILDFTTKCLLVGTAATSFAAVTKSLLTITA